MKKKFLFLTFILSLFIVSCGASEKSKYEKAFFDEGCKQYVFQLDDYKDAFATNDDVILIDVTGHTYGEFDFLRGEALKFKYKYIAVGKSPSNDNLRVLELHKIKM